MDTFTCTTAQDVLRTLDGLSRRKRRKQVHRLLYKKNTRPADLREQLVLLRALSAWNHLSQFDRTYAVVASAHKASELVDRSELSALYPRLEAAFAWARTCPPRNALRMDGVHLRYSLLNVLINGALLLDHPALRDYAATALAQLAEMNPRRASPYLFNSSSNIVKTVALAAVVVPADLPQVARQVRALIHVSLHLTHVHEILAPFIRRVSGPTTLDDVQPGSSFSEFEETFERYRLLLALARATDASDRLACARALAHSAMPQRTPNQTTAYIEALDRHLRA